MVLLDVVYLSMNRKRSYASVTPRLMEDTTLEIELHIRYCNLVYIGLLDDTTEQTFSFIVDGFANFIARTFTYQQK